MDNQTIRAYNHDASSIATLHANLTPTRIYELIDLYFTKGEASIDIGCGIGRDAYWLNQNGYPCVGIDASIEMLNEATALYPTVEFTHDFLPTLDSIKTATFQNILCSAVLMHLTQNDLLTAYSRLLTLINQSGILIISFRGTNESDCRENGKLYEPINAEEIISLFEKLGCKILLSESEVEVKRNLTWHNLVIKK